MNGVLDNINKQDLIDEVRKAIEEKSGFAMGKLGFSEQYILGYLPFLKSNPSKVQIRSYEALLRYHCEVQFGVFPTTPEFLQEFAAFYSLSVESIDILGLFQAEQERKLISQNGITAKLIYYQDTEPDRSIPDNISNCYLPLFANKRILYISPFADLLKERSQKDIFESVWKNTEKKYSIFLHLPICLRSVLKKTSLKLFGQILVRIGFIRKVFLQLKYPIHILHPNQHMIVMGHQ